MPASAGIYDYVPAPLAGDQNDTADPQILKIPRNDLGRTYYLSLRDDTSYDANMHDSYLTGVSVHWYRPDQPGTITGYVTTLTDGQSFEDAINGITVTQNASASDSSWAEITVEIVDTYDVSTPGLDVRSLSGQLGSENTVGPFETAVYAIDLQNNDADGTPGLYLDLEHSRRSGRNGSEPRPALGHVGAGREPDRGPDHRAERGRRRLDGLLGGCRRSGRTGSGPPAGGRLWQAGRGQRQRKARAPQRAAERLESGNVAPGASGFAGATAAQHESRQSPRWRPAARRARRSV